MLCQIGAPVGVVFIAVDGPSHLGRSIRRRCKRFRALREYVGGVAKAADEDAVVCLTMGAQEVGIWYVGRGD